MNQAQHVQSAILGHAIVMALGRGFLDPDGVNRNPGDPRGSKLFSMEIGKGIPMRVWIGDWDHDEIRIAAALWPTANVDEWLHSARADKYAGEVFTSGYVSRGAPVGLIHQSSPSLYIHPSRRIAVRGLAQPKVLNFGSRLHHDPSAARFSGQLGQLGQQE